MKLRWIPLLGLVLGMSAFGSHAPYPGKKAPKRYSAVAIDLRYAGRPAFHFAKDVPAYDGAGVSPAAAAWRKATNQCGGVSAYCYVLRSWGNQGCLGVYTGPSRTGTVWTGHALMQQHPLEGEGVIRFYTEEVRKSAENICNYHAHYDGRGPQYNRRIVYPPGYCSEYDVYCSAPLRDDELEFIGREW